MRGRVSSSAGQRPGRAASARIGGSSPRQLRNSNRMLLVIVGLGRRLPRRVGAVPAITAHANANNSINAIRQQSK
jgi:hypothetical protein